MEIAKAAANAKNENMLENFFRDMQNGTLNQVKIEQDRNIDNSGEDSENNNTDK